MLARFSAVVISILTAVWLARAPDWEPLIAFLAAFGSYVGIEIKQRSPKKDASSIFLYPDSGRHGRNLLSNSTHEVIVDEPISLRAEIPPGTKLHLALKAELSSAGGASGGWSYQVDTVMNWTSSSYRADAGRAEQHFDAEAGLADMRLRFHRSGQLTIEGFEGTAQSASWRRVVVLRQER